MAAVQVPFDIDEAKLMPPMLRSASVGKVAAISVLLASQAPIATITAPAGYGKTTLLGKWAEVDPRRFAWVSLDPRDDDELVFLRDIAASIHRVEPLAQSVLDGLSGPGGSIWTRVPRVGNAIAALQRPMVLALDDLHAVRSPSSLSVLAALVDYVPPGSQIVVTSREKPALPLARWRATGMLLELEAADLRLEPAEADVLLRGASVALGSADVAALTQQTEGWPAGLYLAALSFRSGGPRLGATGFTGDDRYVSDYFRQEVVSRIPKREAQFMMRTSVLDSLNGSLCDAVLETRGSSKLLESLEASNRFVVPLDNRGESYRYHQLFRQLLRLELERREPEIVVDLNRRAMAWYAERDQLERAVTYGQAAKATTEVAGLVERIALPLNHDGRISTLGELLDWFDDDDLSRYPAIAVYAGWVCAETGRATEASRYLSIAERSRATMPLSDGSLTIEPWVATLRAAMMPDGIERALIDADAALSERSGGSWRPDAMTMRGITRMLLGSTDEGAADLLAGIDLAAASGAVDTRFIAQAELALLHARRGSWFEAQRHAEEARAIVERTHLEHYGLAAIAYVAVARVGIHRHHHGDARAAMTRAHLLRPLLDHALPWLTVQVGLELTRAHLALGEVDAARNILEETSRVLARRPDLGTLVDELAEMRARVSATSGDGAWAANLTAAELRLLPYLATYLTFPEIASQLFITSHTVRSEAKAIYRKLDATSRAEAIDRAVDVGLLEPMFPHHANVAS